MRTRGMTMVIFTALLILLTTVGTSVAQYPIEPVLSVGGYTPAGGFTPANSLVREFSDQDRLAVSNVFDLERTVDVYRDRASSAPLFVVNTTDDTDDGTCDAVHCSLREALSAAGAQSGVDTITFDITTTDPGYDPETGVWTIEPTEGYNVPPDTIVDGSIGTAPTVGGSALRPGIEIDGTTLAVLGYTGLRLSENVILRGLVVNHFQYGIWVGASQVTIGLCYVGTDPTGTSAKPNGLNGILVASGSSDVLIQGNLISGNDSCGIRMFGDTTTGIRVQYNRIGTCLDGTTALPNMSSGIRLHAGPHDNTIGPSNVIAFNNWHGVQLEGATTRGNNIIRNKISGNEGEGISLSDGGNGELAAPVITSAGSTAVTGSACANCEVEIFSDAEDEGGIYEGTVTADGAGNWTFTKIAGLTGPYVTATNSDGDGNTSEFSAPVSVLPPTPTATASPQPTSTPTATWTATTTPSPTSTSTATSTPTTTPSLTATPTATRAARLWLPLISRGGP